MTSGTATKARLRWVLVLALAGVIALVWGTAAALGLARSTTSSTQAVKTGVVIVKVWFATGGAGAATGIVLTPSGEVLTNNHVIRGARSIRVTVPSTGRTYSATVEGYSVTRDVALRPPGRPGAEHSGGRRLSDVRLGDSIVTVGNAGGTGAVTVKSGRVVRLKRSITVRDKNGTLARLSGLIETTAPLRPGDSGGPLLLDGEVIGMDAAASSTLAYRTTGGEGYAIPIETVLRIRGRSKRVTGHQTCMSDRRPSLVCRSQTAMASEATRRGRWCTVSRTHRPRRRQASVRVMSSHRSLGAG